MKTFLAQLALFLALIALGLLLAGCAQQPLTAANRPLVDLKGVDIAKYQTDYAECRAYAEQVAGPGTGAVAGAVVGAGIGYLISRLAGSGYDHAAGARVGAGAGAIGGAAGGVQNELQVVRNCLRGRGYSVLN